METRQIVMKSLQFLVDQRDLKIYGYVLMPNHIHLLWSMLKPNTHLRFKKYTGQQLKFYLQDHKPKLFKRFLVNGKDRKYQIWQSRPHYVEVEGREMFEQKLEYIHNNPVQGKWMLANSPVDYKFSSANYYEYGKTDPLVSHYMNDI